MWSLGFGLERVAWLALDRPRIVACFMLVLVALSAFGATRIVFDEDIRGVFAGETEAYRNYVFVTDEFADPENETLLLVEAPDLGKPDIFARLLDLQLELQLLDGVESAFSLFALREPPDADGNAPLIVDDPSGGLTPALVDRIRNHPLLGSRLLSADAKSMVYVVTPSEKKAPLSTIRALKSSVEALSGEILAGTDVKATVTGFPAIRAGIIDILIRDQIVLNIAGAAIGFIMSLIVFRSFVGALLTAVPAITGGLVVIGGLGLLGIPVTAMSNIVPALVMIVGYADGIHLSHSWRSYRDTGKGVIEAEWLAQADVGAACMLTALTTSVSFLSLTISDVAVVSGFGWTGAVGMLVGGMIVLVMHALGVRLIGRFWKRSTGKNPDLFAPLAAPCAGICRFAVGHARSIALVVAGLFIVLAAAYAQLPPQHSVREHLPRDNPANAALGRIDQTFGGAFPLNIVVPLNGLSPTSPEALAKIGAVQKAIGAVKGVEQPLSLWSLVEWLRGGADAATSEHLDRLLEAMPETTRSRFLGRDGSSTLISASVRDAPTYQMAPLIEAVQAAAKAAGGPGILVTGVTVVTTVESARTIDNLNVSLTFAIFADLFIMIVAFRNWSIGAIAVFSNTLPVLATCALLLLLGKGMQFSTVIAMTVAFGVTVDETTHYLNRFLRGHPQSMSLESRLIATSRHVGPVLIGTTVIILAGLTTTLTSGLPTVTLFGGITAATLGFALISDLLFLPALIAGPARHWFEKPHDLKQVAGNESV